MVRCVVEWETSEMKVVRYVYGEKTTEMKVVRYVYGGVLYH